jgi:hypothetical protein
MEENELLQLSKNDDGILAEVEMEFCELSEISEGMCSCVCISDEQCCGCILQ